MKILNLRFKNLNSLYGEWSIDFTQNEYTSNGIFALIGKTGSGKSTILDAICLALYRRTPRLKSISETSNEIMSRQTGECFAEVVFESQKGRFCCIWEQHRSRKKPEGALQASRHEISDALTGKVIESKKELTAAVIIQKTGMDFERFTRSILLAQGSFDAFLKAEEGSRAEILEQITGTEIYSTISVASHERLKQEKEIRSLLEENLKRIQIMSDEDEEKLRQEFKKNLNEKIIKEKESQKISESIAWLNEIQKMEENLRTLESEHQALNKEIKIFEPSLYQLRQSEKTIPLETDYQLFSQSEAKQKENLKKLSQFQIEFDRLNSENFKQKEIYWETEKKLKELKETYQEQKELFHQVRQLDEKLTGQKKIIGDKEKDFHVLSEKILNHTQTQKQIILSIQEKQQKFEKIQIYYQANLKDENIREQLPLMIKEKEEIEKQKSEIAAERKEKSEILKQQNSLLDLQKQNEKDFFQIHKEIHLFEERIQEKKENLAIILNQKSVEDYDKEKEFLQNEKRILDLTLSFEKQRHHLENGKPCPLCGSEVHPYLKNNPSAPLEIDRQIIEIIKKIETIKNFEKEMIEFENKKRNLEVKSIEIQNKKNMIDQQTLFENEKLKALLQKIEKEETLFKNSKDKLTKKFQSFQIDFSQDLNLALAQLKQRSERWNKCLEVKAEIEKEMLTLNIHLKNEEIQIQIQENELQQKKNELQELKIKLNQNEILRKKIFNENNPDQEERKINEKIVFLEREEKKLREMKNDIEKLWIQKQTQIQTLEIEIKDQQKNLDSLKQQFSSLLKSADFISEEHFLSARLPLETRNQLQKQNELLNSKKIALETSLENQKRDLFQEKSKNKTTEKQETLQNKADEIETTIQNIRKNEFELDQKLTRQENEKKQFQHQQEKLNNQIKEVVRWQRLHELIGSADGKKYRNFAQGLTFKLLIYYANRQLEKISDRYLLLQTKDQPLKLSVIDNYQAGEIRPTQNLSGGESFMISLSLALGLSQMASRKVRIDSLFLDEGFGTLDEDSLESALNTLANLHKEGKLIGIISHVSALKERIQTQISLIPQSGGRSKISGPGVSFKG